MAGVGHAMSERALAGRSSGFKMPCPGANAAALVSIWGSLGRRILKAGLLVLIISSESTARVSSAVAAVL
eukprot:6001833-Pyramimonas_sp.AAC.1